MINWIFERSFALFILVVVFSAILAVAIVATNAGSTTYEITTSRHGQIQTYRTKFYLRSHNHNSISFYDENGVHREIGGDYEVRTVNE